MGGGQAGTTNPVLTNGYACRLFYGGVNGTNIYNLNTGVTPYWITNGLAASASLGTASKSNGMQFIGAVGGQGSNNLFFGTITTNATNVGHVNFTNLLTSGGIGFQLGINAQQHNIAWSWGGNPPAWDMVVGVGTFAIADTNGQAVISATNTADSIGLHGNVNVDSNLDLLTGVVIVSNLGSGTVTSIIWSNASQFQTASAALNAWAAHGNTNDFVASQGGKGSNNTFTAPQTTNLTEQGTLTGTKGFSLSGGYFTADAIGNVSLGNTGANKLYLGANAFFNGSQTWVTHPQTGASKFNILNQSVIDSDALENFWGTNFWGLNQTTNYCMWQVQPGGALNVPFIYHNITNVNGNLAMADIVISPTWNVIVQTASGNTTLTLPTSTNWSLSPQGQNATLFGSNTCIFDIDNVGGGNMTICTYDHAMIHMGGGQAGSTNPVLASGYACRLFYGGVNGTNIYNLNTGLFPSPGNDVGAGGLLQRQDVAKNRLVNSNILMAQPPASWSGQMATINSGLTNICHANLVYYYNGTGGSAVLYAAGGLSGANAAANPVITNAIATTGGLFILQPNDGVQIVSGSRVNAYARIGQ
jgi:hypothetical protein